MNGLYRHIEITSLKDYSWDLHNGGDGSRARRPESYARKRLAAWYLNHSATEGQNIYKT